MDVVIVALVIVAVWVGLLVFVMALCRAAARADADADEQRYLAEGCDGVSNESVASHLSATDCDEVNAIIREELERQAERLHVELPEKTRPRRARLVGARRHRS